MIQKMPKIVCVRHQCVMISLSLTAFAATVSWFANFEDAPTNRRHIILGFDFLQYQLWVIAAN